ncbi:MAG TPA: cation transporter [Candidatus Omnitrophica bacterium]|nr:MAG: cation diffusion facilitator family transporter [Omnitrophica WOR_2 bacterium GWA2_45_18]HBR14473.1 cation transporter [Candidatus Omnitrophota bacterium]
MHDKNLHLWQHAHTFGQEHKRSGERRTTLVIVITAAMMAVEIVTGILFGSMALLADGLHMASHTIALLINVFAYIYARRHSHDTRYSFGTGKVNALGGFTGAVLLAVFALMMAWGSMERLMHPVSIAFNQAIFVAIIGLIINGVSVFILGHEEDNHDAHEHSDHHHDDRHDHNLKSAYFHVLADALTSILAIIALLTAKYFGLIWMDPLMGIVGAILVCQWSLGLLRTTSSILLDRQGSDELKTKIKESIESVGDSRVADLHLWVLGPNIYGVIISVVTHNPESPEYYKKLLPLHLGLAHVTVEVYPCPNKEETKVSNR